MQKSKIISTFLGMLVLVGGLGVGIILVEQPQLLNQHAQDTGYTTNVDNPSPVIDVAFSQTSGNICINTSHLTSTYKLGTVTVYQDQPKSRTDSASTTDKNGCVPKVPFPEQLGKFMGYLYPCTEKDKGVGSIVITATKTTTGERCELNVTGFQIKQGAYLLTELCKASL